MGWLWAALAAVLLSTGHANSCLARDVVGGDGWINSTAKLKQVIDANCTSIDFLWVSRCASCDQALWAKLDGITSITGKDPRDGYSFLLAVCPQITNIENLKSLKGRLEGGLVIEYNNNLTTLKGLEGVDGLGVNVFGRKVVLIGNPQLLEAASLSSPNITATELKVHGNPMLSCTPSNWPATDFDGNTVPGPCVTHAPTPSPTHADAKQDWAQSRVTVIALGAAFVVAIIGMLLYIYPPAFLLKEADEDRKTGVLPLLFDSKTGDVRRHSSEKQKKKRLIDDENVVERASLDNAIQWNATSGMQWNAQSNGTSMRQIANDAEANINCEANIHRGEIRFDDIALGEVVGAGSYGKVYKSQWRGNTVAVKIFHGNLFFASNSMRPTASEEKRGVACVEQFEKEVGILARVRHHNVISYLGCSRGVSIGRIVLAIVMEYMAGTVHTHAHSCTLNPLMHS
jgi:hypothetical protein